MKLLVRCNACGAHHVADGEPDKAAVWRCASCFHTFATLPERPADAVAQGHLPRPLPRNLSAPTLDGTIPPSRPDRDAAFILEVSGIRQALTPPALLGREGADALVNDKDVSRAHARIDLEGDAFLLTDLGSTNGTFVNGARVTIQDLVDGDTIRLGSTTLLFRDPRPCRPRHIDVGRDGIVPLTGRQRLGGFLRDADLHLLRGALWIRVAPRDAEPFDFICRSRAQLLEVLDRQPVTSRVFVTQLACVTPHCELER